MPAEPQKAPVLPDLEHLSAQQIVAWALDEYFPDITVACSMQDAVVVDLAVKQRPDVEVFFLQTGFHFDETLATAQKMKERYSLNLVELKPVENPAVYSTDGYEACCAARKVLPTEKYLATKKAWMTGIRRTDAASRAAAKPVEWDAGRGLVKVNPIVSWSDDQVKSYIAENDLIVNPLLAQGYASVGCFPCTQKDAGRQGRWAGSDRLECGLHVQPGGGLGRAAGAK